MNRFKRCFRASSGQDTVEYALLAGFISTAAIAMLLLIGPHIKPFYYMVQDAVRRAASSGPGEPGDGGRGGGTPTMWMFR